MPTIGNILALSLSILPVVAAAPAYSQEGVWTDVFNGKDLTGLKKHGNGTASVVSGVIDVNGGNGYLYTEKDYADYRVKVEWMNLGGGNSGYLYHIDLNKHDCGDWPSGPELQMMQGDVGSIWTTDCKFNSKGSNGTYGETGGAVTGFGEYGCGRQHFVRPVNKEMNGQWNTYELYVKGDSMETKVNGTVVMRISKLTMGGNVPMVKGRMGLQIEGSHVQWRNWQVMDLDAPVTVITAENGGVRGGGIGLAAGRAPGADMGMERAGMFFRSAGKGNGNGNGKRMGGSAEGLFDASGRLNTDTRMLPTARKEKDAR
jgi:hypothetical protein